MKNKFIAAATAGFLSLTSSSALADMSAPKIPAAPESHGCSGHSCGAKNASDKAMDKASKAVNNAKKDMQAKAEDCMVKCYGIAKAGRNDCGAKDGSHGCAGQAKEDCSDNEWVAVKASECAVAKCTSKEQGKELVNKGKFDSCMKKK